MSTGDEIDIDERRLKDKVQEGLPRLPDRAQGSAKIPAGSSPNC